MKLASESDSFHIFRMTLVYTSVWLLGWVHFSIWTSWVISYRGEDWLKDLKSWECAWLVYVCVAIKILFVNMSSTQDFLISSIYCYKHETFPSYRVWELCLHLCRREVPEYSMHFNYNRDKETMLEGPHLQGASPCTYGWLNSSLLSHLFLFL